MGFDIHGFERRLEGYRRIIAGFGHNGEVALRFLDHLFSLGLSVAKVCKYADHAIALLRAIDFELEKATRRDVERVVAWINRQPYREWTKHDKKLILRKLIQYAKVGRCDRDAPMPPEVSWIKLNVKALHALHSPAPSLDWLRAHPHRDDPDAPLWCPLATNYVGRPLSYKHFRLIIKKIAGRAGLRKDVWPYLFRHTTLTKMAKVLT